MTLDNEETAERTIFNQRTLDRSKARLKIINEDSDGLAYEIWNRLRREQEFAKNVFLGNYIIDAESWENPYIYGEHGYVYNDEA